MLGAGEVGRERRGVALDGVADVRGHADLGRRGRRRTVGSDGDLVLLRQPVVARSAAVVAGDRDRVRSRLRVGVLEARDLVLERGRLTGRSAGRAAHAVASGDRRTVAVIDVEARGLTVRVGLAVGHLHELGALAEVGEGDGVSADLRGDFHVDAGNVRTCVSRSGEGHDSHGGRGSDGGGHARCAEHDDSLGWERRLVRRLQE